MGTYKNRRNDLSLQICACLDSISDIKKRINEEIPMRNYATGTPEKLRDLLMQLIEILETHVRITYNEQLIEIDENKNESIEKLQDRIVQNYRTCLYLSKYINYVSATQATDIPWRLVNQLERICQKLINRTKIILYPRWDFNYTIEALNKQTLNWIEQKFRRSDSKLHNALYQTISSNYNYFVLGFPIINKEHILDMAILSHEIGHMVDNSLLNEPIDGNYLNTESKLLLEEKLLPEEIDFPSLERFFTENEDGNEAIRIKIIVQISKLIQAWSSEYFADLYSVLLFGPAAIFSLLNLLNNTEDKNEFSNDDSHPPFSMRVRTLQYAYSKWVGDDTEWYRQFPGKYKKAIANQIEFLNQLSNSSSISVEEYKKDDLIENVTNYFLQTNLSDNLIKKITEILYEEIFSSNKYSKECFVSPNEITQVKYMLSHLDNDFPPIFNHSEKELKSNKCLSLLLNIGWIYWLNKREECIKDNHSNNHSSIECEVELKREFSKINNLLSKSLEAIEATEWINERSTYFNNKQVENNTIGIQSLLKRKSNYLKIIPLINEEDQIGISSIDLRLGNEFIYTKLHNITRIDASVYSDEKDIAEYQSRIYIPFGKPYILHPGRFILASTLEYLVMPDDYYALVVGRSSWGRLGLNIATAAKVDPKFKGSITLEINNLGEIPIYLYPGCRIGQIVMVKT